MISSFKHKGLAKFFNSGTVAGIQAHHAPCLRLQLTRLNSAKLAEDMDLPNWKLHPLKGSLKNHWAVTVDGNWRMVFTFEGEDAVLVDYLDYH